MNLTFYLLNSEKLCTKPSNSQKMGVAFCLCGNDHQKVGGVFLPYSLYIST